MKKYAGGLSLLALAVCCSPVAAQSTPPRNDIIEDRLSPGNDRDVQGGAGFANDGPEGRIQGRTDIEGDVDGRVRGDVDGRIRGDVDGDVRARDGRIRGDVDARGNVRGDARMERDGDLETRRRVDGDVRYERNERGERVYRDSEGREVGREAWNEERRNAARQNDQARVEMFFTKKLENMNQSVIQLSRFAEQRSESRDVQEFARTLAEGHSELNARLEKLNKDASYADRDDRDDDQAQRRSAAYRGNRNADRDNARDNDRDARDARADNRNETRENVRDRARNAERNADADNNALNTTQDDALAEVDERARENRNASRNAARNADRNRDNQNQAARNADRNRERMNRDDAHAYSDREQADRDHGDAHVMAGHKGQMAPALKEICKIEKEATQNYLDRTQQMLERYKGQDFDMAFLGFQIGSHTWALSELNAMQGVGDEEFQKVVADAKQKMEQHLKQAKQLSKKYEDKEGSNRDRNRDRG